MSIATGCWRWLEKGEAEQDRQQAELHAAGIQPEYLDLRSPDDLTEVDDAAPAALLAVAARLAVPLMARGFSPRRE